MRQLKDSKCVDKFNANTQYVHLSSVAVTYLLIASLYLKVLGELDGIINVQKIREILEHLKAYKLL